MICPKCKSEIEGTPKFCPECGEKLVVEPKLESVADSTEEKAAETVVEKPIKKSFFKRIPKAVKIIVPVLLVAGIVFGILYIINPGCMFGHRETTGMRTKEPTCVNGEYSVYCVDCGVRVGGYTVQAILEHDYGSFECGTPVTCKRCNKTTTFQHSVAYGESACEYCKKDRISIAIPKTPLTVADHYNGGIIRIESINVECGYSYVDISFVAVRLYHEKGDSYSASGRFGWKLYDENGVVIDSGTEYTDGTIKVGEKGTGSFSIFGLTEWTAEYKLEILDLG